MSVHDRTQTEAPTPWLSRPQSIRVLWIGFAVVLALTVLAQLFKRFCRYLHGLS